MQQCRLYSSLDWKPGDSILIPIPTFGYYAAQAANHKIKVDFIATSEATGWKIIPEELNKALTKTKAKIFLFTNPVNPTGVIYNKEEVEKLVEVLKNHKVLVISDEVFKYTVFHDSSLPFSISAVKGMEDLSVTLNGVGKSMGLAGMRLSYAYVPSWLADKLPKPLCGLSKPVEKAAIQALQDNTENQKYLKDTAREYKKK